MWQSKGATDLASDHDIGRQVLDEALKENGDKFDAGYVFVAGFRPLELRGEVWPTSRRPILGYRRMRCGAP
jgi:hypothetical protein